MNALEARLRAEGLQPSSEEWFHQVGNDEELRRIDEETFWEGDIDVQSVRPVWPLTPYFPHWDDVLDGRTMFAFRDLLVPGNLVQWQA